LTLLYGIIVGIPAILSAKYLLAGTMMRIQPTLLKEFDVEVDTRYRIPTIATSLFVALLPVVLIGGGSVLEHVFGKSALASFIGNPSMAMMISVLMAIWLLGVRTGRTVKEVMGIVSKGVSSIAVVMLIVAGAGAL